MKLVSAASAIAVLLGVGALIHPTTSYAQLPYCLPQCPTWHLECIKGNQAACNSYYASCMNCMELRVDSGTPAAKRDSAMNAAWVNSRQTSLAK
jgi:hypothetical protein